VVQVVGQAVDGISGVQAARELRPDVVLMDLSMPHLDGVEATRRITAELPGVRVLVLTSFDDPVRVRTALEAGLLSAVLAATLVASLVLAFAHYCAGLQYDWEKVARDLVADLHRQSAAAAERGSLSSPRSGASGTGHQQALGGLWASASRSWSASVPWWFAVVSLLES
jgi:DNA-binding NarL/FixJ family response regulator